MTTKSSIESSEHRAASKQVAARSVGAHPCQNVVPLVRAQVRRRFLEVAVGPIRRAFTVTSAKLIQEHDVRDHESFQKPKPRAFRLRKSVPTSTRRGRISRGRQRQEDEEARRAPPAKAVADEPSAISVPRPSRRGLR